MSVSSKKRKHNEKEAADGKKKAIAVIDELQDILGVDELKDSEEKELEEFLFGHEGDDFPDSESEAPDEEVAVASEEIKPAWEDVDDEAILLDEKAKTLRNCHRSVSLRGSEKYSNFVQEKFKKIVGENPKWADITQQDDADDDDPIKKTGNFTQKSESLPKEFINVRKTPSLVDPGFRSGIVKCAEFHPSARVALMAGTSGLVNLFQIDGKINAKIQSVEFENFPIYCAHFSLDGKEIFVGSKMHGYFHTYDMYSGKTTQIRYDRALHQTTMKRFHLSPDGKYIVIHGKYGCINLLSAQSKEWIGCLKMNGHVMAIAFSRDGSKLYSHGVNGEVYIWDLASRKCIHKFVDEGSITGTALAISPNDQFLAAGSDSGVVNIYDTSALLSSHSPKPLKALMNLTTEVTQLKFNCTSELLVMNSSFKENSVKLVHFPSMTVFSNFPLKEKHNLSYVNSIDISVNSGYVSLGNNKSTIHILRLKHYHNY